MRTTFEDTAGERARIRLSVRGAVQGVGFRPFIYRLAVERGLAGWVSNSPQGVEVEIEGPGSELKDFLSQLEREKPSCSSIDHLETSWLAPVWQSGFRIRESERLGQPTVIVHPDIATCPDCLHEVFDEGNRRFRYPFTNCTQCGPRFTIIEALPYDRLNTSMRVFEMCPDCRAEYEDPENRRFHAEPNACPVCGPQLEHEGARGSCRGDDALMATAEAIRRGEIAAVKGIGGFHLMVDAGNDEAVARLRARKHRETKPFAVMVPSVESAKELCEVSKMGKKILCSPEAPIVLLRRVAQTEKDVSDLVAPGNPNLGLMLPSNPLHHLLMAELRIPVIATSGNLSDEPICIDESEARARLGGIADVFLVHDRRIVRHVDDSITRVLLDEPVILRRARGYAPLPLKIARSKSYRNRRGILALGGHLKNSIALAIGEQVFLSQHVGDLESDEGNCAFRRVVHDFRRLYSAREVLMAADLHPDYRSTRFAEENSVDAQVLRVQHHVAHVLSCMAENGLESPLLGVAWDGTGYGTDGTIWGGEVFRVTEQEVLRVAHLRQFRLPGGEVAVKEPRRAAFGVLHELFGKKGLEPIRGCFTGVEFAFLRTMLERKINSPMTSSAGRLFDAVASIIGLRQEAQFEGQAAMELEFAAESIDCENSYPFEIVPGGAGPLMIDWAPLIREVVVDAARGIAPELISARFHNGLVESLLKVLQRFGERCVVLSGGCFQNAFLLKRTVTRLREAGFSPYWHRKVPPNDGGLALGQVMAVMRSN